jgi:Dual specificity phosphatase, catalytic domain
LPSRRLTHITRQVYVGGQIGLSGWRLMESWGVSALLNLRIEWDDRWMGIHAPHYLWLPAIDGTPPVYEQLVRGAQFIQRQVDAGRSIYVHCAAGLGRGPTMVTAYLVAQGLSVGEAIAFIAERRPFISLSVKQRARLLEFEARVRTLGLSLKAVKSESPVIEASKPLSERRDQAGDVPGNEF